MPEPIPYLREGNFVECKSKNMGYFMFADIVTINRREDGSLINYSLHHRDKKLFVGYSDEVFPIYLTGEHIHALGFRQNDKEGHSYNLDTMYIVFTPTYVDNSHAQNPVTVLSHPRIFIPNARFQKNVGESDGDFYNENTVEIPCIHSLQNYLFDQGRQIDFSVLTT